MAPNKILQFLKFFIGWPVSLLAVSFIARLIIQNKSVTGRFGDINFALLFLSIISFLLYFLWRAFLWHKIIEGKGYTGKFRNTVYLWESAEIKRFTPGFIWTLMSKTFAFSKNGLEKKTVAYSLAIEAETFLVGCFIVSLLSLPLVLNHFPMEPLIRNLVLAFLVTGAILSSSIFIFANRIARYAANINFYFLKKSVFKHTLNSLPLFSPIINLQLLAIGSISLLFFGLAVYLAILSIAFLTPALALNFVGFFVLSLLIGYLSFLIPMGLGIREGVIIYGLSTFMPIGLASASAVLTRITLVISELIFFGFTFAWNKTKNELILKTENFILDHKQEVLIGTAILIYVIYFTTATFLRYDNFYTGRFDLGNMDQAVWNTIHGRIFETTGQDGIVSISRLSSHADFILILISPLYLLWEDPRMLLLLQTVVLGLGAVFVFKIAGMILGSKNAAAVFSLLFLLNPAVHFTNLYDFHPVTLATTLLLGTFYFLMRRRYVLFLLFAILAGITKEEVWLIIGLLGLYMLVSELVKIIRKKASRHTLKNLIIGGFVSTSSFFMFYWLIWHVIPATRGQEHFALSYFSEFGNSPSDIVKNIFSSPGTIIGMMGEDNRMKYLVQLFLPLGFLSFLSPIALVFALPDLGINLLSSNSNLHQIYYQYSAAVTPFIFIAAILGVKNLSKWSKKLSINTSLIFLVIATLFSAHNFGPLPGAQNPNIDMFTKQLENRKLIQAFISGIPEEYKVAATNNLGSHLSRRVNVFTIPDGVDKADILVFLLNDPFAQPSLASQKEIVEILKKDQRYKLLFTEGDFVVFQKKSIDYKTSVQLNLR
ncbi:MAG: DUF2079 domain-containing protein [Candidatus Levyibacteriota bacterium]